MQAYAYTLLHGLPCSLATCKAAAYNGELVYHSFDYTLNPFAVIFFTVFAILFLADLVLGKRQ
jgi:hypothetical protein